MQSPQPEVSEPSSKKQKVHVRPSRLNVRSPTVSSEEEEEEEAKEVVLKPDPFLLAYSRPRPRPPPAVEDIRARWFRITAPSGGKPYVHIPLVPESKKESAVSPLLRAARRQRESEPLQLSRVTTEPAPVQQAPAVQHTASPTANPGDKPFKCSECHYTSTEVGNLRRHLTQTGHRDLAGVAVGPYLCQDCGYASSRFDTMQTHLRTAHGQGKNREKFVNKLGRWTDEEDARLRVAVEKIDSSDLINKWSDVAAEVGQRTPKQCRERWNYQISPQVTKGTPFSEREIEIIRQQQAIVGNRWSEIALHLPGRTSNSIKNLWHWGLKGGGAFLPKKGAQETAGAPGNNNGNNPTEEVAERKRERELQRERERDLRRQSNVGLLCAGCQRPYAASTSKQNLVKHLMTHVSADSTDLPLLARLYFQLGQLDGLRGKQSEKDRWREPTPQELALVARQVEAVAAAGFPPGRMNDYEKAVLQTTFPDKRVHLYLQIRNLLLGLATDNPKERLKQTVVQQHVIPDFAEELRQGFRYLERYGYINFGVFGELPEIRTERRIAVIGAGFAGLAAALHLRGLGHACTVLEARSRVGGRTREIQGADAGAAVVTGTKGNPFYSLCRQLDLPLYSLDSGTASCPLFSTTGQRFDAEADERAETRFNQMLDAIRDKNSTDPFLADKEALSLGSALNHVLAKEPATEDEKLLFNWHIANLEYGLGTDLEKASLLYWDQDDRWVYDGPHCLLPDTYSHVAGKMAAELGSVIQLQSEVLSVHWSQTGGVDVTYEEDSKKTEHFDSVIVTVPLGVLKAGSIDFQPPLPAYKLASIDKLGYGNLNKVMLTFPEVFWGDTDFFGIAQPAPGPRGLGYIFWNIAKAVKKPVLVALLAGQAANEAEKGGVYDDVIIDRIMENLRAVFGDKVGEPHSAHVTHWGTDPYARGCYSYVGVAASGLDYDLLARPVGDVLFFAGEATNRRHPSTVAGAIESGIREAARIDRLFGASADTERFTEPEFAQQVRSTHAMIPFARSGRNQEPEPEPVPEEKNNEDGGEEPKAKRQKIDEEGEQPEPAKSPKPSEGLLLFECDACRLYLPSAAALRSHQDQSHPRNTVG